MEPKPVWIRAFQLLCQWNRSSAISFCCCFSPLAILALNFHSLIPSTHLAWFASSSRVFTVSSGTQGRGQVSWASLRAHGSKAELCSFLGCLPLTSENIPNKASLVLLRIKIAPSYLGLITPGEKSLGPWLPLRAVDCLGIWSCSVFSVKHSYITLLSAVSILMFFLEYVLPVLDLLPLESSDWVRFWGFLFKVGF